MTPAQQRRGTPRLEECFAVRIPQAAQMIGVGRSTLYALIARGELKAIKIGRSTVIATSELRDLIERQGREHDLVGAKH